MNPLSQLIRHFERFPGIGSRQARRFAFHILTDSRENVTELARLIEAVRASAHECPSCARFSVALEREDSRCPVCRDSARDPGKLLVVERDIDIDAIERSSLYDGLYFVLGGTIPLLESVEATKLRGGQLRTLVEERTKGGVLEVILGFPVNPDGENTARYVEGLVRPYVEAGTVKVTHLGRGLSTGSELEYADPETIKNALKNRH